MDFGYLKTILSGKLGSYPTKNAGSSENDLRVSRGNGHEPGLKMLHGSQRLQA